MYTRYLNNYKKPKPFHIYIDKMEMMTHIL